MIDTSHPVADVARELGLVAQTLENWVHEYRRPHANETLEKLIALEKDELARLRKGVRELCMDKEFLGKAAPFFAKEYR